MLMLAYIVPAVVTDAETKEMMQKQLAPMKRGAEDKSDTDAY